MDAEPQGATREALELAIELAAAAIDYHLNEVQIDGAWIRTTAILRKLETALAELEATDE